MRAKIKMEVSYQSVSNNGEVEGGGDARPRGIHLPDTAPLPAGLRLRSEAKHMKESWKICSA